MTWDYLVTDLLKTVDGDTVDLSLAATMDFGFHVHQTSAYCGRFRLVNVDTPERGQPGYNEAAQFTANWIARALEETVLAGTTYKADSFGRWLVDLWRPSGESLSEALLREGHAEPYTR